MNLGLPNADWKSWPLAKEIIAKGALEGNGLFVAAPTGTGKSYVATRLTIEYLREMPPGYVSFYLVPLKALAEETFSRFQEELAKAQLGHKRISIATGDYDDPVDFASTSLVVATYEKLNALMKSQQLFLPYVVVADEFQIVGEGRRGPLIEGMMALKFSGSKAILFALSAVVNNAEQVAKWLGVNYVIADKNYRTVPLIIEGKRTRDPPELVRQIVGRELETHTGSQLLVFCKTIPSSEKQATGLAKTVKPTLTQQERLKLEEISDRLLAVGQFNSELAELCKQGVAYHNAMLTKETKREIEKAFRDRALKVIACTPTLAQGINTPAKVVIVRDITRYSDYSEMSEPISTSELLNMVGRAGRPDQKQEVGIAYVVNASTKLIEELNNGKGEPLTSRLGASFSGIARFVLQLIRSKDGTTKESILRDAAQSLWAFQNGMEEPKSLHSVSIVDYLRQQFGSHLEDGRVRSVEMVYKHGGPTIQAVVRSFSGDADHEVQFYSGGYSCDCWDFRKRKRKCRHIQAVIAECLFGNLVRTPGVRDFVFIAAFESDNKLSVPIQISYAIDLLSRWQFIEEKEGSFRVTEAGESAAVSYLPIDRLHALWEYVKKVDESVSAKNLITTVYADIEGVTQDQVAAGDINSLMEWMDEAPPAKILRYVDRYQKFVNLKDEILYALQTCDEFAGILKRNDLQNSIRELRRRVRFGVRQELLPLAILNISGLARELCRPLFVAGIRNLEDLKEARPEVLSKVLAGRSSAVSSIAREMWERLQACVADPSKTRSFLSTYRINPDNAVLLGT